MLNTSKQFTPEFGACIELINNVYSKMLIQLDTLDFLNQVYQVV